MHGLAQRMAGGSAAGVTATLAMSAFLLVAHRLGWLHEQAPEEITERSFERLLKRDVDGRSLDALTAVTHLSFGAAAGAGYGALSTHRLVKRLPAIVGGTLYGTLVWLASYWGALPRLGLMPPPPRDERRRPLVMLVAHWIYGAVLGVLTRRAAAGASR